MKCKNCGKGRPHLFNKEGGFCNQACYDEFRAKGGGLEKSGARVKGQDPQETDNLQLPTRHTVMGQTYQRGLLSQPSLLGASSGVMVGSSPRW